MVHANELHEEVKYLIHVALSRGVGDTLLSPTQQSLILCAMLPTGPTACSYCFSLDLFPHSTSFEFYMTMIMKKGEKKWK